MEPSSAPETKLKHRVMTTIQVNYHDWEKFVRETYPAARAYSFVADMECSNDTSHQFVVAKRKLESEEVDHLNQFATGKRTSYTTHTLFLDCCNRDLIPAGAYVIHVCW